MKRYTITFYTKQNRQLTGHEETVEAGTAKEARAKFDASWQEREQRHPKPRHAFGITVKLEK